jgi:hypothetical protein
LILVGAPQILAPGSRVGEYRIEQLMRTGPRGAAVYRAAEPVVGRTVALHVVDAAEAEQFLVKARRLAGVEHPNLPTVYATGSEGGLAFAATADPRGRQLDELTADARLSPERAVEIGAQVVAALEALEEAGIAASAPCPDAILVADQDGLPHAWLSPLEDPGEPDGAPAAGALARLLESITLADGELAQVLKRAEAGDYGTPSEVVAAARAAVPVGRRRVRLLWPAVAAAAVGAGAAAVVALSGGDSSPRPSSGAPAGRLVAKIDVGAPPVSVGFGEGFLWAATEDRTVVRIDPETNRASGVPVRFSSARGPSNITVRAGGGAVFAIDGHAGTIVRIDPEQMTVTRRTRLGPVIQGAAVEGDSLWITRTTPESVTPRRDELLRLDAATLRPSGAPTAVGAEPLDIELDARAAYVTGAGDGSITRVDRASGATRKVSVGSQPLNSALAAGRIWAPSPLDGATFPVDAELSEPGQPVRGSFPVSAVALAGHVWIVATSAPAPDAPAKVVRLDPETGRLLGRPLRLGENVGWPTAGAGSLWIPAAGSKSVLRMRPAAVPGAREPKPPAAGVALSGPLSEGSWRSTVKGVRFSFSLPSDGWMALAPMPPFDVFELRRFDGDAQFGVSFPDQLVTPDGGVRPATTPASVLAALERLPHLEVAPARTVNVGGVRGYRVDLRVRPHQGYPPFCSTACVPLFATGPVTTTIDAGEANRLVVLAVNGKTAVIESGGGDGTSLAITEPIVRSLRFDGR